MDGFSLSYSSGIDKMAAGFAYVVFFLWIWAAYRMSVAWFITRRSLNFNAFRARIEIDTMVVNGLVRKRL